MHRQPVRFFGRLLALLTILAATLPTQSAMAQDLSPDRLLGAGLPTSVAVSPDGHVVAVGTSIGVYRFNADTLDLIDHWNTDTWVASVAFSKDGNFLRVNQNIHDAVTGSRIDNPGATPQWIEAGCSPDGVLCATLQWGSFKITNTQTLVVEGLVSQWYTKGIAWSPDGTRLYTVSGGKSPSYTERSPYLAHSLRVYDTKHWTLLKNLDTLFADTLSQVFWSGDSRSIATLGARNGYSVDALMWDIATGQFSSKRLCTYRWQIPPDCSIARVDNKWVDLFIRNPVTGRVERQFRPHRVYLWATAASNDYSLLATSGENNLFNGDAYRSSYQLAPRIGTTRIWNYQTLQAIAEIPVLFYRIAFSVDGTIVVGQTERTVEAWDWQKGRLVWSISQPIEKLCYDYHPWCWVGPSSFHLAVSGDYLATYSYLATNPNLVAVWRISTGEHIANLVGHTARVTGLAFSPDGRQIAASGDDGVLAIWNTP